MPQQIGLSAVLTTKNFSAGLQEYITGLNRAIRATTMAASAISQQAAPLNNVLGGPQFAQNIAAYNAGLTNAVANTRAAAQAITAAIRGIPPIPAAVAAATGAGAATPQGVARGGARRGSASPAAQQDLRIQKLLHDEVKDIVDLEKQRLIIVNQTSSPIQRQLALRKQELIEARQLVRQQELLQSGISQRVINQFRGTPRTPSTQQRDAEIFKLQQEELRDLIVLEQSRRTMASRTATEYQKQLALLNAQAAQSRQGFRQQRLVQLGVDQGDINKLRSIPVVLKDFQSEAKRATAATQALTARTIALGVAAGTLAVSATRALASALSALTKSVVDVVSFFDELTISVQFYAVRALAAKGITTDYETALRLVGKEAQGTLIWIQRLAIESPFKARDVGNLFRTAQAYGLLRDEALILTPLLIDFAAAAGLSNQILERLALAIGQVRARGKLTGEEIRQLGNSGIPIRDILVKQLGIANSEFDKLVESGAILSGVAIPAIIRALEEFRGAARRVQFETLGGIINAFKELSEFATFRFFSGVLAPIKEELLGLFTVLNQTNIAARITAIGEAVGRGMSQAIRAATVTIQNFIKGWQALDPVIKRQIILFGLSSIAVTLFAASIGLVVLALKLLVNRIALTLLAVTLFVTAWTGGFKSIAEIAVSTGNLIGAVFGGISNLFSSFFRGLSVGKAPTALGRTIGDDLNRGFRETQGEIKQEIKEEVDSVAGDALIAGSAAGAEFLRGWKIPNPAKVISEELQAALDKFGSGPHLTAAGIESANQFFEPFKSLDFSFFDDITSTIRGVLQNAVNLGEVKESDLPAFLFGEKEALAEALAEFRRFGSISQRALNNVRVGLGKAGEGIASILSQYTRLATVTDVVEATQEKLNNITQKYKDIITPIRKELEAISELRRQSDEGEEILALQRTLNNEAVSGARKRTASLRIEEIRKGATLRGLENERDLQTEIANDELAAAQKLQKTLQDEIDLLKARFDAQQANFNLLGDEASIFRQLQEEISKLRDKEKTDLEKQLEFLGLINEELEDAKKLAKAKFDLASGETTEFEKQQALLTIQSIEFERQQRALKATELGFDPAILAQLRDVPIHLSDIGEFTKDAAANFDEITDLAGELGIELPDLVKFADDWNLELGKARQWWVDIQTEISNTANLINENLPDFLSIFPDQKTGVPPIISNINGLTLAIAGLIFFAPQILGIIGLLGKMGGAIGGLSSLFSGAGAAAAGGTGAAAAAGGITLGGAALTAGVIIAPLAAVATAIWGVPKIIDNIKQGIAESKAKAEQVETEKNVLFEILGRVASPSEAQALGQSLSTLVDQEFDAGFVSVLLNKISADIQAGKSSDEIGASLRELFDRSVANGFSTENQRRVFENVVSEIENTLVNTISQSNIAGKVASATQATLPLDSIIGGVASNATGGTGAQSLQDQVAQAIATPVINGITAGLDQETISALVFNQISAGVIAGLDASDPATVAATDTYIASLLRAFASAAEIDSPSELTKREIGIPLAEGIVAGIEEVTAQIVNSTQLKKVMAAIALPFSDAAKLAIEALTKLKKDSDTELKAITTGLSAIYKLFFADVKTQMTTFRTDQRNAWIGIRNESKIEVSGMKDDLLTILEALRAGVAEMMGKVYDLLITNGFKKIRTDAEAEIALMRVNVVAQLVGEEDSLLADLQKAIGGVEEETPAWSIGESLILGIAAGITDNKKTLIDAMKEAIKETFEESAKTFEISSPSMVAARTIGRPIGDGIGLGIRQAVPSILSGMRTAMSVVSPSSLFPSRAGTFQPQSVSNVSRTQNFNLNVGTNQSSQGVIGDFTVMKSLASGA